MDYFNGSAILNTSGTVLERYAYSAFGVRRIMAADFSPRTSSSYAWDFGFQGQFREAETDCYNYGYRYYVPLLGRWINRDPISEDGGTNLFEFVESNPTNLSDDLGHRPGVPYRHHDPVPGMGGGGGGGGGLRPIRIPSIPKPSPRPGPQPGPKPEPRPIPVPGPIPRRRPCEFVRKGEMSKCCVLCVYRCPDTTPPYHVIPRYIPGKNCPQVNDGWVPGFITPDECDKSEIEAGNCC